LESLEFAANLHTPRFDFLLPADREPAPLVAQLLDHLLSVSPRPDVVFLKDLPRDSRTTAALHELAPGRGLRIGVENERRSPRVAIEGTWEAYLRRRPKHFRSNLGRYERRWNELGGVLDVVDDPARTPAVLEEGLALEASGWKGSDGTAILGNPEEASFYRGLPRRLAGSGWLRQYVLRLDGRAIAWDLCLMHEGVCYALKTAYDEAQRANYPGFELQRQELVGAFNERRVGWWDLLPPDSEFKGRWCDHAIEQLSLRMYTTRPRARLAHLLFARLRPWLARSPHLRRLKDRVSWK
jgi:CelD/BcsL family acetyltransferase involved in cellulose biosynthesis